MRNQQKKKMDIPKWGTYLRERWRGRFASHLSLEEQKEIGMDGFLWHLCSWGKVDGHMDYSDLYVMDWEENWTFVMTHETDCGPYFIQK